MRRPNFKGISGGPDVRLLKQREKRMATRKGMRKGKTKGHDVWKVVKLPLFGNPWALGYSRTADEDDDMEPDYVKKHKNIMK